MKTGAGCGLVVLVFGGIIGAVILLQFMSALSCKGC